ncbi:hypothetical protein [Streptomyces sp. NPDC059371]|uniref:hypothetical protein n=1 Tax=Streptomyces sp. NPDC059371 TaxID=3346812 RepID=UPI003685E0BE
MQWTADVPDTGTTVMVQPADGTPPAPEALAEIMPDVEAPNDELRAVGTWVLAGGPHGPETATVLYGYIDRADHSGHRR